MHEEVRLPGLVTIEHSFEVPLEHDADAGPTITVFAREVADPDGRDRPFLVFLQGARVSRRRGPPASRATPHGLTGR